MITNIDTLISYWHASVYEQTKRADDIVRCILNLFGSAPLSILEPGCGTGKIAFPLSESKHTVTGMDLNAQRLKYAEKKADASPRLRLIQADILLSAWPKDFDAVILGADLMHSIITDWEYKQAQKQLILKSANSLRKKGLLFLDFDCPLSLSSCAKESGDRVMLEGTDERGVYGKMYTKDLDADDRLRLVKSRRRFELTVPSGQTIQTEQIIVRHFLTLEETTAWLYRAGFTIEALYGSLNAAPFSEENRRCVILARKE